jgi:hypothetical protein
MDRGCRANVVAAQRQVWRSPRRSRSARPVRHRAAAALWFGWWMYNMVEPQELWIEIAVDFQPVGCAK